MNRMALELVGRAFRVAAEEWREVAPCVDDLGHHADRERARAYCGITNEYVFEGLVNFTGVLADTIWHFGIFLAFGAGSHVIVQINEMAVVIVISAKTLVLTHVFFKSVLDVQLCPAVGFLFESIKKQVAHESTVRSLVERSFKCFADKLARLGDVHGCSVKA